MQQRRGKLLPAQMSVPIAAPTRPVGAAPIPSRSYPSEPCFPSLGKVGEGNASSAHFHGYVVRTNCTCCDTYYILRTDCKHRYPQVHYAGTLTLRSLHQKLASHYPPADQLRVDDIPPQSGGFSLPLLFSRLDRTPLIRPEQNRRAKGAAAMNPHEARPRSRSVRLACAFACLPTLSTSLVYRHRHENTMYHSQDISFGPPDGHVFPRAHRVGLDRACCIAGVAARKPWILLLRHSPLKSWRSCRMTAKDQPSSPSAGA